MKPGDLVFVDFGTPVGSEPGFIRPAVILTAETVLARRPRTIHVVPVTTNIRRSLPTEIPLDDTELAKPSVAQCHLCTVVSIQRIVDGEPRSVGAVTLAQIRSVMADLLDID